MKTIIAATDFSNNAQHAVGYAADFAKSIQAKLVIFNAVTIQPIWSEYPVPEELYEEAVDASGDSLARIKTEMENRTNGAVKIETVEKTGTLKNELEAICKREKPVAVFIATHLAGTLERILIGSHALQVAKHSDFPVIVVPPLANFTSIGKIALALDLNDPGDFPFHLLKHWVQLFHAKLDIVYIVPKSGISADELPAAIDVQTALAGIDPHFHLIENKKITDGIYEYVEINNPDILIVFPKKHTWFHKSESNPLIFQPPVLLMIWSRDTKEQKN
ncbi:MAG: universal stress protein [Arachidicoccus sp.]|nr:universal stress protein [Arachidicoccus sp.]